MKDSHVSKNGNWSGEMFCSLERDVYKNEHRLNAHGGKLVFAGTPSDNENKLTVIMDFESMESLKNFGSDEELTKTRVQAGAMVETGVMTIMNEASFISTKS